VALSWPTLQNAIVAWVNTTTGLQTMWENQRDPQLPRPFATVRISSPPKRLGCLDAVVISTDLTQVGAEIQQTVRGQREMTVTVHCISPNTTGAGTAMEYASAAMVGLSLPSQIANLYAAGLSIVDFSGQVDATDTEGASFVSHSFFDVRFAMVDDAAENTGYISEVDITPTYNGVVQPIVPITGL
jgi:hypothetical protein